ncbi:mediator of RNA polymerase II transcription subunit 15 [Drosophila grimshawi]|uniref:GH19446 n=1 Tax=Drosophila grimshawi TaxID=7222 RepID=B4JGH5_DROGR|nr:mediator of RNA polymerase II transcription subunit 15 [Drosophila grimshawi]EDV93672.1 GH19446 [Drosophila grimshawi]
MVRTNRRKGIEEVYGTKLEALQPTRVQPAPQPGMTKTATMRVASSRKGETRTQRSYVTANDYYITTNVPLNTSSAVLAHPSKAAQMPVQTQAISNDSMSNRRIRPTTRQLPANHQPKVNFVAADKKAQCHTHPHAHTHPYGQPMPLQMTHRTVYAPNTEMDDNLIDLSDKNQLHGITNGRRSHMHPHQPNQQHIQQIPHPLQHQLHQQQQQQQFNQPGNNNIHHHSHPNMKHKQQQQQPLQQQQQQQQQQQLRPAHAHQRGGMQPPAVTEDEEKDEDPEELFELIRQTVRRAVGTTISEVVNRNFRDMAGKMERFSNELKMTNDYLGKLQNEVTNKVIHYGEENTRHFRYLCMKSEYDKMFYQQQKLTSGNQTASKVAPTPVVNHNTTPVSSRVSKLTTAFKNVKSGKQFTAGRTGHGNQLKAANECVNGQNPCACCSTSKSSHQHPTGEHQSSSAQSVNVKSTGLGVREVLGQIQRFCTQMQINDLKEEMPIYPSPIELSKMGLCEKTSPISNNNAKAVASTHAALDADLETPVDSTDEIDNFDYSSDAMSSFSDGDDSMDTLSGNTIARPPMDSSRAKQQIHHSNKGAGDGQ